MKRTLTLLTVACFAASLWAQTPHTPPSPADRVQHEVKFLTTLLNLNSSQQTQATSIFTAAAASEAALRDSTRTAHQTLDTAIKNNDSTAIDQATATLGQLQGQQMAIEAKAHAAFVQILSADQQTKFATLRGPHGGGPRGFGRPGFGGPVGPGGPPPGPPPSN